MCALLIVVLHCFNPRPPLLASEPARLNGARAGANVSIHARHYWRASLEVGRTCSASARFQSTPAITGERAPTVTPKTPSPKEFQSTPAITGERASTSPTTCPSPRMFQSTPAITGERAWPRCSRATPSATFQSTPAITGERALHPSMAGASLALFQSTPAITGERAPVSSMSGARKYERFNPRPPLLASEPS